MTQYLHNVSLFKTTKELKVYMKIFFYLLCRISLKVVSVPKNNQKTNRFKYKKPGKNKAEVFIQGIIHYVIINLFKRYE